MTKNKYGRISNLKELETAQKNVKRKLRWKEREIEDRLYGLRDDYSAQNLFGMTMRSTHTDVPLLRAVRLLKKKISAL